MANKAAVVLTYDVELVVKMMQGEGSLDAQTAEEVLWRVRSLACQCVACREDDASAGEVQDELPF